MRRIMGCKENPPGKRIAFTAIFFIAIAIKIPVHRYTFAISPTHFHPLPHQYTLSHLSQAIAPHFMAYSSTVFYVEIKIAGRACGLHIDGVAVAFYILTRIL